METPFGLNDACFPGLLCAMRTFSAILILVTLLLAGCVSRSPLACPDGRGPRLARVYFGTDRKASVVDHLQYGGQRSEPPQLHMGWEDVTIGLHHRVGMLDGAIASGPASVSGETSVEPGGVSLHRTDVQIERFAETILRPALRALPVSSANGGRQVLLFIHGFNNSFDEAVRKTAQFAGDLDLVTCSGERRGLAIAYSWPAEGQLLGYLADEESVEWTQQRLEPFLRALARVCREEHARLEIVAHSMGARLLVRSLAEIANSCEGQHGGRLADQVVLLAPDIGKGIFDQYLERILPLIGHLTVYVSAKDQALSISSLLHGGHYRLGFVESSLLAALKLTSLTGLTPDSHRELGYFPAGSPGKRIDMIDVSSGLAASFGHSYEDPRFIRDLKELVLRGTPAGSGARSNLQFRELKPGLFQRATGERLRYFKLKAW